jgi:phosphoribosylformylglycinamidine synthase
MSGQLGAQITLPLSGEGVTRWDEILFAEGGSRIILSVTASAQADWEAYLAEHLGQDWSFLGRVCPIADGFRLQTLDHLTVIEGRIEEMTHRWSTAIAAKMQDVQ